MVGKLPCETDRNGRFIIGFTTLLFHALRYLRLSVMRLESNIPNESEALTQDFPLPRDPKDPGDRAC